jgi:diguanylate cyclase (GGDEF)-like protein/putative nucleotidyltransferase with HDIG domain
VNPSTDEQSLSGLATSSDSVSEKRSIHMPDNVRASGSARPRRTSSNPLLNIPIGRRLALGFLIPALIAAITLSSVGVQSQQRLVQESIFYQNLLDAYTSLTTAVGLLQEMHTNLLETVTYAARPHPSPEILRDDQTEVRGLATRFNAILATYLQQDLLEHYPDLVALFTEAGHGAQVEEQQTYSEGVQATWQAYRNIQEQVLRTIMVGSSTSAQMLVFTQEDAAFTDAERDLHALIKFNGSLVPSLHDAATVEVHNLLTSTILAVLGVLVGIGLVGWLISSTLVQRLRRLRSVVQAIENGQVDARLNAGGRDEIADVSEATNAMLDTLVGLLEETKRQRDELAKGEELKCLHEALQREQEALKEANTRLAALATIDPLTDLPNHRALLEQLDKEVDRARRYGHPLSVAFFDADRFKRVNDTYGHGVGDIVLRELSQRVCSVLRGGDTLGRYGGEEFMVVLPETDLEQAKTVAERMRAAVAAFPLATARVEGGINATISLGIATYPADGMIGSQLREKADQAMYWAKRLGRNQVRTATEAARASIDTALSATIHSLEQNEERFMDGFVAKKALHADQLALVYSLMWLLELRNHGIFTHSYEVSDLATAIAREMGMDEQTVNAIATAALLHDIGKIAIPDALLQKEGVLSPQEWTVIKQHPELGAQILEVSRCCES